jgi:pyridoxal phosphate enzyme (YggS family)
MLSDNIADISGRILKAAERSGRRPEDIKLVAVSKTVGVDSIRQALEAGQRIFGENRVQEALEKISALSSEATNLKPEWHFIGHLQRNKAKFVAGAFELIHSVDSIALADELQRQAEKNSIVQRILIEIKLSEEETKHGADEEGLEQMLEHIKNLKNLKLEGLMTIPPFFADPEMARPYFRHLRELRDRLQCKGFQLPELSMGMSNDFEVAVEEGATLVRVGTAIFGERG